MKLDKADLIGISFVFVIWVAVIAFYIFMIPVEPHSSSVLGSL